MGMKIRITSTPTGEALEDIRQAWIGLEFPVAGFGKQAQGAYVSGVVSGVRSRNNQLIVFLVILAAGVFILLPYIQAWLAQHNLSERAQYKFWLVLIFLPFVLFKYVRIFSGRVKPAYGYPVNALVAVEILAQKRPDAADWWRSNCPYLFAFGGRQLLFRAECCQVVEEPYIK